MGVRIRLGWLGFPRTGEFEGGFTATCAHREPGLSVSTGIGVIGFHFVQIFFRRVHTGFTTLRIQACVWTRMGSIATGWRF